MNYTAKGIRPFIGAKDFQESRAFYVELGFEEHVIDPKMSLFKVNEAVAFYLQDYYAEEWMNNLMVFLEVDDIEKCYEDLHSKDLPARYPTTRLLEIKQYDWGRECFLIDPAGALWHFGEFNK
jgi:catechol 2,3-dioxygenase-like lactoylglutathione lyase family enzyme